MSCTVASFHLAVSSGVCGADCEQATPVTTEMVPTMEAATAVANRLSMGVSVCGRPVRARGSRGVIPAIRSAAEIAPRP